MAFDLRSFRAPFITREAIWEKADSFRSKYWSSGKLPVDVLHIAEIELSLEIRPIAGLKSEGDIDALLLGDHQTLVVDSDEYMSAKAQNRLRFSVAHELGHLVLHSDIYSQIRPSTIEEWIRMVEMLPEEQYSWVESHAYEFAGRLLVPRDHLQSHLDTALSKAEISGLKRWDMGVSAREYIASFICRPFHVSADVISRRLEREGLWPPR